MNNPRRAVVLLSGGMDSATTLAMAKDQGFQVYALSFRYGQRHAAELRAASRVAQGQGVAEHRVMEIDLAALGGSALTSDMEVPKDRPMEEMGHGIPITYVPARNTVFLALALAWAEVLGAYDIFIGVNAVDYSGYPDCRPEFIAAFEGVANLATRAGVQGPGSFKIHTPLANLSKGQIIAKGLELGVDYAATLTCYDPDPQDRACGRCDACLLRRRGFAENGLRDPAPYAP